MTGNRADRLSVLLRNPTDRLSPGVPSGIVEVQWSDDAKAFAIVDKSSFRWSRWRRLECLGIDLEVDAVPSALAIRKKDLNRDPHDETNDDHEDGYGHIAL